MATYEPNFYFIVKNPSNYKNTDSFWPQIFCAGSYFTKLDVIALSWQWSIPDWQSSVEKGKFWLSWTSRGYKPRHN
jgi:hypothetical protein